MGCEISAYLQLGTIAGPKHRKYPVLPEYAFRSRRKAGSEGERLHDREVARYVIRLAIRPVDGQKDIRYLTSQGSPAINRRLTKVAIQGYLICLCIICKFLHETDLPDKNGQLQAVSGALMAVVGMELANGLHRITGIIPVHIQQTL